MIRLVSIFKLVVHRDSVWNQVVDVSVIQKYQINGKYVIGDE